MIQTSAVFLTTFMLLFVYATYDSKYEDVNKHFEDRDIENRVCLNEIDSEDLDMCETRDKQCWKQINKNLDCLSKAIYVISRENRHTGENVMRLQRDTSEDFKYLNSQIEQLKQQLNFEQSDSLLNVEERTYVIENIHSRIDKINDSLQSFVYAYDDVEYAAFACKKETKYLKEDMYYIQYDVKNLNELTQSSKLERTQLESKLKELVEEETSILNKKFAYARDKWVDYAKDFHTALKDLTEIFKTSLATTSAETTETEDTLTDTNQLHVMSDLDGKLKHMSSELDLAKEKLQRYEDNLNLLMKVEFKRFQSVVDKRFEILQAEVENIRARTESGIDSANMKVSEMEKNIDEYKNENEQKVLQTRVSVKEISNNVDENIARLQTYLDQKVAETETDLQVVKGKFGNLEEYIAEQIAVETKRLQDHIDERFIDLKAKLQSIITSKRSHIYDRNEQYKNLLKGQCKQTSMNTDDGNEIADLEEQIGSSQTNKRKCIRREVDKLAKETEELSKTVGDQKRMIDAMYPNIFNKDMFIAAFLIVVVLLVFNYFILFCLIRRNSKNQDKNGIRKGPGLEPGVCIISFDESRTPEHRRLLESANVPNCKVEVCVIRKHEHIHKLPRCKVYLMCTEFSERHVIIEEPGKGLGDLHRTTYYEVKALGGCLIILYTKDPLSKNLSEDTLYNTNIYCVTHQPELSILNDDGRFFSVYDYLTQHQKTELRNKIVQNMT